MLIRGISKNFVGGVVIKYSSTAIKRSILLTVMNCPVDERKPEQVNRVQVHFSGRPCREQRGKGAHIQCRLYDGRSQYEVVDVTSRYKDALNELHPVEN